MKRLHVSVGTADIEGSVAFYSTLFGVGPSVRHDDYAKWMLDDPRVNFVVNARSSTPGVDHLGIQVESEDALEEITGRLTDAANPVTQQEATTCCYHISDKTWSADPQGVAWETFLTSGESTTYGKPRREAVAERQDSGACGDACCP